MSEFAVYDTGQHYLIAKLKGGNPVQGLMVDKWSDGRNSLLTDIATFDGERQRIGSLKMGLMQTAKLAAHGKYLARLKGGKVVEYTIDALDDGGFCAYAGIQPEE